MLVSAEKPGQRSEEPPPGYSSLIWSSVRTQEKSRGTRRCLHFVSFPWSLVVVWPRCSQSPGDDSRQVPASGSPATIGTESYSGLLPLLRECVILSANCAIFISLNRTSLSGISPGPQTQVSCPSRRTLP